MTVKIWYRTSILRLQTVYFQGNFLHMSRVCYRLVNAWAYDAMLTSCSPHKPITLKICYRLSLEPLQFVPAECANKAKNLTIFVHAWIYNANILFRYNPSNESVTFWYGSGSSDPYLWSTDPDFGSVPVPYENLQWLLEYRKKYFFPIFFLGNLIRYVHPRSRIRI
jgi:hypothetical protein